MRWLKPSIAMVVLALWGLAVVHCRLEALPGWHLLETCCADDPQSSAPSDCDDDGCRVVEDGGYRVEEPLQAVHPPPIQPSWAQPLERQAPHQPRRTVSRDVVRPPPWLIDQAKALPPRAPSLAS